jgi:K+-transporting ATPase ATPase C chain
MLKHLRPASTLLLLFTLLTGVVYPAVTTALAHALFSEKAQGSLLRKDGQIVGSALIGQTFSAPQYFHGRPSAAGTAGYDAAASSGSNYGPTSKALADRIAADIARLRVEHPGQPVPADLVTASGSGLDPHISPAGAEWQVDRVAAARGLPPEPIRTLVRQHTEGVQMGVLGEPAVNVLELNLALDALQ